MAYGRHQSFYIRSNWISKGIKLANENPDVLLNNLFLKAGLGKNMLSSLNFWLVATGLVDKNNYTLKKVGELIYKYDSSAKKNLTKNIIHYNLCSTLGNLDSFYWFFNVCNEIYFTKESILEQLITWDALTFPRQTSDKTLKRDIDCLISTYTIDKPSHPEDKNYSYLGDLGLISSDGDIYYKKKINENKLSLDAFFYFILLKYEENPSLLIDDLIYKEGSIGRIFNISRADLIEIIERLSSKYKISVETTNNLDYVSVKKVNTYKDPIKFLEYIYGEGNGD